MDIGLVFLRLFDSTGALTPFDLCFLGGLAFTERIKEASKLELKKKVHGISAAYLRLRLFPPQHHRKQIAAGTFGSGACSILD